MSSSIALMIEFRERTKNSFDMRALRYVSYFLVLEVRQCESGIHISQIKYIDDLLKEHNMLHCKPVIVPLNSSARQQVYEIADETNVTTYRRLICKLMYLTHSRQDIVYVVNLLSRHKPT